MRRRRPPPQYVDLIPVTLPGTDVAAAARAPLVREEPDRVTVDPISNQPIRCDALKAVTEQCFVDAYASGDPKRQLGACYTRAYRVVRDCKLGVSISGSRRR